MKEELSGRLRRAKVKLILTIPQLFYIQGIPTVTSHLSPVSLASEHLRVVTVDPVPQLRADARRLAASPTLPFVFVYGREYLRSASGGTGLGKLDESLMSHRKDERKDFNFPHAAVQGSLGAGLKLHVLAVVLTINLNRVTIKHTRRPSCVSIESRPLNWIDEDSRRRFPARKKP